MDLFQDEGDNETSELSLIRMKRKFEKDAYQNEPVHFQGIRQNLLSEFDGTPTKVVKRHSSSRLSFNMSTELSNPEGDGLEKLRQEVNLKEADIMTLNATIMKWQNKVKKLEVDSKEALIKQDRETANIKAICDREKVKSSEMQSKLQYLMEKEKLARDESEDLRKEMERQKMEMDKKVLNIHREKLEEGDRAQHLRSKWLETEASLREELMTSKYDYATLKTKYDESEAQLALRKRLQKENGDQSSQIQSLIEELKEEKEKNKELNRMISDNEDNLVTTKALKRDLDLVPSMKIELEKLRLDNEQLRHNEQNTLLLEEELRSVKRKLEDAEVRCEKFTELEIINEDLQARLQRWEASDCSGSRRPQSPSSLSRRVNELETSQAMMLLKQGGMETNLKREQLNLERAMSDNRQLSLDLSAEKELVNQRNDLIKRLKRKLLLVTKERDSYKNVLDSYESEATINVDAQNQRRIQQLEEVVKGYHSQNEEIEAQLNTMEEKLSAAHISYDKVQQELQVLRTSGGPSSKKQDQDAIAQLREQVALLENSLLKVQEEKDILDARIEQRQLQGEYDPSKTDILHLIDNPSSQAEEKRRELVKKLTAENDTLRKRNEILESNEGVVEDLTIQVNEKLLQPSPTKELEAMKQELKRQETRNKRLMEVYTKTSREFRDICYQLTGYKIDIPCPNQYRLTNMYSLSANEYLWFQQNEQGEIQLLQTEFSSSLEELMEKYLQKQHSMPLFLSQVTMDLHSKQTMIL